MGAMTKAKSLKKSTDGGINKESTPAPSMRVLKEVKDTKPVAVLKPRKRILVLVEGDVFPDEMMTYALNMARRMNGELVAVNTAPLKNECVDRMSALKDSVCTDFESGAAKNAGAFIRKAEEMGIGIIHKVAFYGSDKAVDFIEKEVGKIDLVISVDVDGEESVTEGSMKGEKPKKEFFVYSL